MPPHLPHRLSLRPWLVVAAALILYLGAVLFTNAADPMVFVTLGTRFTEGLATGTEGYDGQFTYFIARDPFLQDPARTMAVLDVPPYRYQRILLPLLAHVASAGIVSLLPWMLVLINSLALVGSTALVERLLESLHVNRWYALVYGLFPGLLMATRLSLSEPLAYGLVIFAIWLYSRQHFWLTVLMLALAALSRETTLLFLAGFVTSEFLVKRWQRGFTMALAGFVPFAAWQLVLFGWFGAFGIGSGGAMATPFEVIPLNGFLRIYTDTGNLRVFLVFALLLGPTVILPTLWGLWQGFQDWRHGRLTVYTLLLAINALIILFVPFSTFREPLGMLRFMIGLVISVLLYAASRRNHRVLRYSTLWLVMLAFVVSSG